MQEPHSLPSPLPCLQQPLDQMVLSLYQYEGGGSFVVPALPGDHLSVTLSGANVMGRRLEGQVVRGVIGPGDLTLVPRGLASCWTPEVARAQVLHLLILPSLWEQLAGALDLDMSQIELQSPLATPDPFVEQIGRRLLAEVQSPWGGSQLLIQSLEQSLAVHLLRHYSDLPIGRGKDPSPHPNFRRTLDFIETHLTEDLSLARLAACEGLSVFHFARQFKKAVGQSPHQYVIGCRLKRAQHLLRTTPLSLTQIAVAVGFANYGHLHRHFKRSMGLTPQQYRQ